MLLMTMPGKEGIDIAIKITGLGLNNLNFFIAICVAFGGWILTRDEIISTPPFCALRKKLAFIFFTSTGALAYGSWVLLLRGKAALTYARSEIPEGVEGPGIEALRQLYDPSIGQLIVPVQVAVILAILYLILWHHRPAKEKAGG